MIEVSALKDVREPTNQITAFGGQAKPTHVADLSKHVV
jgi:hypothetical protein